MRVSGPAARHSSRNADLRPGTGEGGNRDHAIRPAHGVGFDRRSESKALERRLCDGQHDPDPDAAADAKPGLHSRQAWKGQAGASVQSYPGWPEATGDRSALLGGRTTEAAKGAGGSWLDKHEAGSLTNNRGGAGGLKNLRRNRCIYIYLGRGQTERKEPHYE